MASSIIRLFTPLQLPSAAALLFTAQVPTQILKLSVSNTSDATAYTVTFHIVPSGGAVDATNMIVNERSLLAQEAWDVWPAIGQVLAVGDAIWGLASTAAVVAAFGSGLAVSGG